MEGCCDADCVDCCGEDCEAGCKEVCCDASGGGGVGCTVGSVGTLLIGLGI